MIRSVTKKQANPAGTAVFAAENESLTMSVSIIPFKELP
jgi:hypothetical protein